ncbi:MAG: hypothetical protein E7675_00350 [Ruminococcaceae bacterium]|nr:hypothetical protein [Oscillospiraceae bacterium]
MNTDNIEHPMISEARCLDMTNKECIIRCPVCREECERVYFKIDDPLRIIGCDVCIDYEDSLEYMEKMICEGKGEL